MSPNLPAADLNQIRHLRKPGGGIELFGCDPSTERRSGNGQRSGHGRKPGDRSLGISFFTVKKTGTQRCQWSFDSENCVTAATHADAAFQAALPEIFRLRCRWMAFIVYDP